MGGGWGGFLFELFEFSLWGTHSSQGNYIWVVVDEKKKKMKICHKKIYLEYHEYHEKT